MRAYHQVEWEGMAANIDGVIWDSDGDLWVDLSFPFNDHKPVRVEADEIMHTSAPRIINANHEG